MVIDFHTHIFPDKIAESAIRSLEKSGGTKANIPATKNALTASMKTTNIDYSVNMPIAT